MGKERGEIEIYEQTQRQRETDDERGSKHYAIAHILRLSPHELFLDGFLEIWLDAPVG